eukprot:5641108-Pleurochrysis_carterae.AAC.1
MGRKLVPLSVAIPVARGQQQRVLHRLVGAIDDAAGRAAGRVFDVDVYSRQLLQNRQSYNTRCELARVGGTEVVRSGDAKEEDAVAAVAVCGEGVDGGGGGGRRGGQDGGVRPAGGVSGGGGGGAGSAVIRLVAALPAQQQARVLGPEDVFLAQPADEPFFLPKELGAQRARGGVELDGLSDEGRLRYEIGRDELRLQTEHAEVPTSVKGALAQVGGARGRDGGGGGVVEESAQNGRVGLADFKVARTVETADLLELRVRRDDSMHAVDAELKRRQLLQQGAAYAHERERLQRRVRRSGGGRRRRRVERR